MAIGFKKERFVFPYNNATHEMLYDDSSEKSLVSIYKRQKTNI